VGPACARSRWSKSLPMHIRPQGQSRNELHKHRPRSPPPPLQGDPPDRQRPARPQRSAALPPGHPRMSRLDSNALPAHRPVVKASRPRVEERRNWHRRLQAPPPRRAVGSARSSAAPAAAASSSTRRSGSSIKASRIEVNVAHDRRHHQEKDHPGGAESPPLPPSDDRPRHPGILWIHPQSFAFSCARLLKLPWPGTSALRHK
jgi:hypothetical protein